MFSHFENIYCSGMIYIDENDVEKPIRVKCKVNDHVKDGLIYYIAASPPDYRASYYGSGLPFYSQVQAFEDTPNTGKVYVGYYGDEVDIPLMMPNAYYVGLGTVYVPPTLYLEYLTVDGEKRNISIILSEGIPYRSLTWPGPGQRTTSRSGPMFYETQFFLPVRSQEQILRDSAYPTKNQMETNFWGLKPPV